MADEVKPTLVPLGYGKLPTGVRCRCIKLWTDGIDHYCCKGAPPMTLPSARIDELLAAAENCPFCGCEPIGYEIEPHSHALAKFMPDHPGSYVIECPPCDFYMSKPTKAEAIAAWNRRPPVKAQAEREGEDAEPVAWQPGEAELARRWAAGLLAKLSTKPDHADDCLWLERIAALASPLPVEPVDHIADAGEKPPVEPVTVDEGMVERLRTEGLVTEDGTYVMGETRKVIAALSTTTAREAGWQPIETAPKDGRNVLLYADGVREYARYVVGHWGKALLTPAQWFDYAGTKPLGLTPTHWRPLPTPPSALHHGGGR